MISLTESPATDTAPAGSLKTGSLLYILARAHRARVIVEFGTAFGASTIHLARALQENYGGKRGIVIGTEYERKKIISARRALDSAGLDDLVEIREGDALETLTSDLPTPVDLVLLNGATTLYLPVLQLLDAHLTAGSIVVADTASRSPGYLAYVRTSGAYVSTPAGDDIEISMVANRLTTPD